MKIGVCCTPDTENIEILKKYNFDFAEIALSNLFNASEDDIAKMLEICEASNIYVESSNNFFPGSIKLYNNSDYTEIKSYVHKALSRLSKLGGKVAVLGSGRARNIPEEYDRNLAEKHFIEVVNICGDIAGSYGLDIAIEPLSRKETNLINTVAQGIEFCERVNHEHVKCLADFYHIFSNNETLDAIENSKGMLIHTHIARPNPDRNMPTIADIEDCKPWAQALKKCNYKGRMSLEGGMKPDFETALRDIQPVLELFRDI